MKGTRYIYGMTIVDSQNFSVLLPFFAFLATTFTDWFISQHRWSIEVRMVVVNLSTLLLLLLDKYCLS